MLAKGRSGRGGVEKNLFEVGEGSRIWRRERREGWKRSIAVDDADGVFRAKEERALVVVVEVLVREEIVFGACVERGSTRRNRGRLVLLGAGGK